jgi:sialate O-acetylesterase
MKFLRVLLLLAAVATLASSARAEIKLHPLFADHMVLQQQSEVKVWGKASANQLVTVTLKLAKADSPTASIAATADANGNWIALLKTPAAGSDYELNVTAGTDKTTLKDVAVGEVWVCSGQSNMEWKLNQLPKDDQGKKVAEASTNKNIRLFTVPNRPSGKPEYDFPVTEKEGKWLECNPANSINFSAVGYFFGRDIEKEMKVPVGLISSDWGGTSCQSWTSRETLTSISELKYYVEALDNAVKNYDPAKADEAFKKAQENYKAVAEKAKAEGKTPPRQPQKQGHPHSGPTTTTLFNGMIAPIKDYRIKGAIWYQGESNAGAAAEYYTLFPAMIQDWRSQWGYEFPFFTVQLAPFKGGASGVDYAELRDAQLHATKVLKQSGIAIITDSGDETDIHPQQKEPVGKRLALSARAMAYGQNVVYRGPSYRTHSFESAKGVVEFENIGGGLMKKGDTLNGFSVCGEDRKFYPATATIDGSRVVITSDQVKQPVAIRFGWTNFAKPELNFFNKEGLPAEPFRTDNFPLTTSKK